MKKITLFILLTLIGGTGVGYVLGSSSVQPKKQGDTSTPGDVDARVPVPWRTLRLGNSDAIAASEKKEMAAVNDREVAASVAQGNSSDANKASSSTRTRSSNLSDDVCQSFYSSIADMDISIFSHQLEQGLLDPDPTCLSEVVKTIEVDKVRDFISSCLLDGGIKPENVDMCLNLAPLFYAYAVEHAEGMTDFSTLTTPVLANLLTFSFSDVRSLTQEKLNENIAIANEVIMRQPDAYGAYKAKLISLVLQEAKYKAEIDEEEFAETLAELYTFDQPDPTFSIREESLQREALENLELNRAKLDALEQQQQAVTSMLSSLVDNSDVSQEDPTWQSSDMEREVLDEHLMESAMYMAYAQMIQDKQEELRADSLVLSQMLEEGILLQEGGSDPDLVKIPFLRYLAQGNLQGLIETAESYIEDNPGSPFGYYFLAQGLWRSGNESQALNVMDRALQQDDRYRLTLELMQKLSKQAPMDLFEDLAVELDLDED